MATDNEIEDGHISGSGNRYFLYIHGRPRIHHASWPRKAELGQAIHLERQDYDY